MKRVVVTGLGVISPVGNDVSTMWKNISQGQSGISLIDKFDTSDIKTKVGAAVKDFKPLEYMTAIQSRRFDLFSQYALAASKQAFEDANLSDVEFDASRFGIMLGSGIGGADTWEQQMQRYYQKNGKMMPTFLTKVLSNMASGNVAIDLNAQGHVATIVTACASGTHAIGMAMREIQVGAADIMLAGGSEAALNKMAVSAFESMTALSSSQDPNYASIPFNKNRDGFVMGEGSGMLVLEEYEHAVNRGAVIYAELVGFGATCDAYHMTTPREDGVAAANAIKQAMAQANITADKLGYINAHGTSTPFNDLYETNAIKLALQDMSYHVPVSSTKSMTGHLLGASGALEAIITIKSLTDQFVPPTINLDCVDEGCDLDYVANQGREVTNMNYALSNSLGFGGHNASIIFKRWQ